LGMSVQRVDDPHGDWESETLDDGERSIREG
jgi:hypothetical protein